MISDCNAERANQRMVDRLIATGALWTPHLIAAFRQTPRHRFLERFFVHQQRRDGWQEIMAREPDEQTIDLIYADQALVTRLGRSEGDEEVAISSSSQPSLMAEMLEDLRPRPGQRVLEIGAGTGYNAALLAHAVSPGEVHTVDVDREVIAGARRHCADFRERKIHLHHGDGRQGWVAAAPFDRIMVTAATADFEPAWLSQAQAGGILVAPLVLTEAMAFVARGQVCDGVFEGELTRGAYFMPLRSELEAPGDSASVAPARQANLKTRPAPWASWFDRQRPRLSLSSFLQAIVFYGWLRGLEVLHAGGATGFVSFGVASGDDCCWFSAQDWQVGGSHGHELGEGLWRAWLQAGGPWPTEFCLSAAPCMVTDVDGPECYVRQGPLCSQRWQLRPSRQRPAWR
jgi:protein-L-isoaspartate(D-aspartate) O-methyltransferase